MPDIFVNKSGNDSDSGATAALAKLTIGGATAIAVAGDRIRVQTGVYNETVVLTVAGAGVQVVADGLVILDGQNVLATGISSSSTSRGIMTGLFNDESCLIVKDFTSTGMIMGGFSNSAENLIVRDCPNGIILSAQQNILQDCLVHDCATRGIQADTSIVVNATIRRCTVVDCAIGVDLDDTSDDIFLSDMIVARQQLGAMVLLDVETPPGDFFSNRNNFFFDGTSTADFQATTGITTLAAWRTASGGDAQSISSDPLFVDSAKKLYMLDVLSPSLTAGTGSPGGHQGFFPNPAVGISNNVNAGLWDDPGGGGTAVYTGVAQDGSQNIELIATPTGTYESGALVFGVARVLSQLLAEMQIIYPAQVLDSTTGDIEPNRLTLEVRGAATAPALALATYFDFEFCSKISNVVAGPFTHWQFRVTFRDNGVAA